MSRTKFRKETTIIEYRCDDTHSRIKQNLSFADYERINHNHVKRGEIYIADIGDGYASEQGGVRPVLIIQNDVGNKYSPTTTIIPLTSSTTKSNIPTHYSLKAGEGGLKKNSVALVEQAKTIDKSRIMSYVGRLSDEIMSAINGKIALQLGLSLA